MALDKQRILNELNSVVNQLQSADCGCIGKLFSTPDNNNYAMNNNPMPSCGGYGHGDSHICRRSCGAPHARNPHETMNMNSINRPCTGHCNPSQLYADTYNYLNGSLMQPVVQEVYNDLKSINAINTIPNNPIAGNMGLQTSCNNENHITQPTMGKSKNNATSEGLMRSALPPNKNNKLYNDQRMECIAGMGPQIVNMMGDSSSKPDNMGGQSTLTGPMVIDAPQSPHGKIGVSPVNFNNADQSRFVTSMGINKGQGNSNAQQYMYREDTTVNSAHPMRGGTPQKNVTDLQQINNVNANPAFQQMAATHLYSHGPHARGVAKFNEMFPGVMQGVGGDLSFDPMAIAIQMNPANQQKVAMETMQKVMNTNPANGTMTSISHSGALQPIITGENTILTQGTPEQVISNTSTLGQATVPGQTLPSEHQFKNITPNYSMYNAPQPQEVFTTINSHNINNQHEPLSMQYPQTLRQVLNPNTGTVISPSNLPTLYEGNSEPYKLTSEPESPQLTDKQQIKEQIFPVDSSAKHPTTYRKQEKIYEYNTLGQPVEMLSAKMYHMPEPNLPQTLAPQPVSVKNDHMNYSNVKSTVSKTSLIHKAPVGRTSNRTQLQQIYNQYKGSQSYTQQNIKESGYGTTQSEGNLKVIAGNSVNQAPVERVGDSVAKNTTDKYDLSNKVRDITGHNGDMLVSKSDAAQKEISPTKQWNSRNGLQDITYTSYPTSTAWSFHGQNREVHKFGYHKKFRA